MLKHDRNYNQTINCSSLHAGRRPLEALSKSAGNVLRAVPLFCKHRMLNERVLQTNPPGSLSGEGDEAKPVNQNASLVTERSVLGHSVSRPRGCIGDQLGGLGAEFGYAHSQRTE